MAAPRPASKKSLKHTSVQHQPVVCTGPGGGCAGPPPAKPGAAHTSAHPPGRAATLLLYLAYLLPDRLHGTPPPERAQPEPRQAEQRNACGVPPMHSHEGHLPATRQPRDYWVPLKGEAHPSTDLSAKPCSLPQAGQSNASTTDHSARGGGPCGQRKVASTRLEDPTGPPK